MKKLIKVAVAGSAFMPFIAFAGNTGTTGRLTSIEGLIERFSFIIAALIPFIMALAVLVIIWGIFNYISGAGDEEKRAQAKQYVIWGIIGLFVMVSIWGLVNVLQGSFDFKNAPPASVGIPSASANCPNGIQFDPVTKTSSCR